MPTLDKDLVTAAGGSILALGALTVLVTGVLLWRHKGAGWFERSVFVLGIVIVGLAMGLTVLDKRLASQEQQHEDAILDACLRTIDKLDGLADAKLIAGGQPDYALSIAKQIRTTLDVTTCKRPE
jgi:hypothetical protein